MVGLRRRRKIRIEKYQDLEMELQKIWNVKVKIRPLVVGSLLGAARVFRKVLEI